MVREARVPVAGMGHSGNNTALDLLSDFAASTPAAAGTHIADALRRHRDSQQHVAELRAQNDELRMQLRQVQIATRRTTTDAVTGSAAQRNSITSQQNAPTLLRLVLALPIGMLTGRDAAATPASAMKTAL